MDVLTLVVAGLALAVSVAALTWQIVSYLNSGSRGRISLTRGLVMWDHGPRTEIIGVTVHNVGRTVLQVTSCYLLLPGGVKLVVPNPRLPTPGLPQSLEPGHQATWNFEVQGIEDYMRAHRQSSLEMRGGATTGTGRKVRSDETVTQKLAS